MAAKSIWKGDLSVGLVTVPVAAYVATDDGPKHGTNWLHTCHHPVNLKKTCAGCGATDIPMADVLNGVKQADGSYVVLSKEELASIKIKASDTIVVEAFVPATEVDPLYVDGVYYLAPGKATPGFALLREAMVAQGVMLTGRLALHGRERRVAIRPFGKVLVLQLLHTTEEVRAITALPNLEATEAPVDAQQLALMTQLVGMYAGTFNPTAYTDTYHAAFDALVEAKRTGAVVPAPVAVVAAPVVDFMEALKASLAAAVPPPVVEAPAVAPVKRTRVKKTAEAA